MASPAVLLYLLAITGSCRRVLRLVVMLKDALLAHHACRFPAEDFSHFLHISNDMALSTTDRACPSDGLASAIAVAGDHPLLWSPR